MKLYRATIGEHKNAINSLLFTAKNFKTAVAFAEKQAAEYDNCEVTNLELEGILDN